MDSPRFYPGSEPEVKTTGEPLWPSARKTLASDALRYAMLRICIKQLLSAIGEPPYRSAALAKAVDLAEKTLEETA